MDTGEICQFFEWDTAFFGVRIARLIPTRLTEPVLQQALNWCQSNAIECLYYLADSDHTESVRLAEQNGFNLVDIRMTFERHLSDMHAITAEGLPEVSIRPSQSDDLPYLRAIARDIYHDTRFYYDPHFPKDRADALYVTWIEKSCKRYADEVLVLESGSEPVGYIACHISNPQVGRIGLVGVNSAVQGIGAGQRLVHSALRWFADRDVERVEVVTQGRNCRAQRLYQRCGFLTRSVQLWYHKWFST